MPTYKEARFPLTYRAAQAREIMDAIARLRSIAVYGLAGMGKSNLFRFLVSHPQVKQHYLGDDAARFDFVFVDCNFCDPHRPDALLHELDAQMERAGIALPEPASSIRLSIRARLEAMDAARVAVILLDPLDLQFVNFEKNFWAYLRGLRDVAGNVVFVLGGRRPPPPLRELQELLTEACWVPPLTRQDAFDSLARDADRLHTQFSEDTQARLYALSGGHPGLLKNSAEWVGRNKVNLETRREILVRELLETDVLQEVCRDLWADLEPEWKTLHGVGMNARAGHLDARALAFLQRAGIVAQRGHAHFIFAPLFARYVYSQIPRRVRVRVAGSRQVELESWQGTQSLRIAEGPAQLLFALAQQPTKTFSRAQLSKILYEGEPRFSAVALAAQIRRLRNTLNLGLRPLLDEKNFNALVPERKQGYRLNLESTDGWQIEYDVV